MFFPSLLFYILSLKSSKRVTFNTGNKTCINSNSVIDDCCVAVTETTFVFSGKLKLLFHVMIEDKNAHISLIRSIEDFKELDMLIHKHFPKQRVPLPKLTDKSTPSKKNVFSFKKRKSNTRILEKYLKLCINSLIGHSSIFRDFLSAQRNEDKVIWKNSVCEPVIPQVTQIQSHDVEEDFIMPLPTVDSGIVTSYQHDFDKFIMSAPSVTTSPPSPLLIPEDNILPSVSVPVEPSLLSSSSTAPVAISLLSSSTAPVATLYPSSSVTNADFKSPEYNAKKYLPSSFVAPTSQFFPSPPLSHSFIDLTVAQSLSLPSSSIYSNAILSPTTSITGFPSSDITFENMNYEIHSSFYDKVEEYDYPDEKINTVNGFELIKVLGKGATGKVILARHQTSRTLFAVKAITKAWHITEREVDSVRMERKILATIAEAQHPFLIRLYQAFQDDHHLYLALDYHAGGDLSTLMYRLGRISPDLCRIYAAQIMMGLQELHSLSILHRDLKPENILISAEGNMILTDFGLSVIFDPKSYYHSAGTFCGTPQYMAPEVISQTGDYSYAADYWSFGILLYEMLIGVHPFEAESQETMFQTVLYGDLIFPDNFDEEATDIISSFLSRDPLMRLCGKYNIRRHPFFANHLNWKDIYEQKIMPAFIPTVESETDLRHFDPEFLDMSLSPNEFDSSVYRKRWYPGLQSAGLAFNAFEGYSYIENEYEDVIW